MNERITIAETARLSLILDESGRFVITDGWNTDYPIFYDHKPEWAVDGLFFTSRADCPNAILHALDRLAGKPVNATCERWGSMLRIYDNGGKTADRYSIAPPRHAKDYAQGGGRFLTLFSGDKPAGCSGHDECKPSNHLGTRIAWGDLPDAVQDVARQTFPEYAPVTWRGRVSN